MNRMMPVLLLAAAILAAPASAHDPSGESVTADCTYVGVAWGGAGLDQPLAAGCLGQSGGLACATGPVTGPSEPAVCVHVHDDKSAWLCAAEANFPDAFVLGPCVESPSNLVTGPVDSFPYPYPITCPPTRGICIG